MASASVFSVIFLLVALAAGQESITGGISNVDPNDPEVRGVLDGAVATQNAQSNDEPITVLSVNNASSQVVAGTLYRFDYEAEGQRTGTRYNCHSEVLDQPWTNPKPQVVEHQCNPLLS